MDYSDNINANTLYQNVGFHEDGVLIKNVFNNGVFKDEKNIFC